MQTFILVTEYIHASPLVTAYTNERQARDAFVTRKSMNYCPRVTLYEMRLDSLGWDQAVELDSYKQDTFNVRAA